MTTEIEKALLSMELGRDHEGWGCHREAQVYYSKAAGFRAAADILRKAIGASK